jgi:rhodanese-related sulfurtransferase
MGEEISSVGPAEAREMIEGGAQLVDVRTDHEWEAGRIPGASHIELGQLGARAGELEKGRPVVLYCRGDNRSDMAAAALAADGYQAAAIAGGIEAWVEAGQPIEPEGGYVAESGRAASILEARNRASQA